MNDFDSLFSDFMSDMSDNKKNNPQNYINNILKHINKFDISFGEPSQVKNYEENGMFFQELIWDTQNGKIVKTIVSNVPFSSPNTKKIRIPLEKQLENAINQENYELAAKLRDKIQKKANKKIK